MQTIRRTFLGAVTAATAAAATPPAKLPAAKSGPNFYVASVIGAAFLEERHQVAIERLGPPLTATTMYCFPSILYVIGDPLCGAGISTAPTSRRARPTPTS
jgi:hypothetical protein